MNSDKVELTRQGPTSFDARADGEWLTHKGQR